MTKIQPPAPPYVGPAAHTSAGSNQPIYRVVIHCTVSPCAKGGARATAAYFREAASGGSAHYVVDPGEAVQVVYDDTIAWHAPPNQHSIGVELCDAMVDAKGNELPAARWGDADHKAMLKRAAHLVARLCLAYDVPITKLTSGQLLAGKHGICGHADVSQAWHQSDHWDPGTHFPWDAFIAQVKAAADKILNQPAPTPTPPPPTPPPAPKPRPPLAAGEFVHVHTSGLGTSAPKLLDAEIHDLAGLADVITTTEDYSPARKKALAEKGFTVLIGKGGNDQCGIVPKDATWDIVASGSDRLTDMTYFHTDGTASLPIKATWAVLDHKVTGRRLLVLDGHYPPSIEGQGGDGGIWSGVARRVDVMRACITGLKHLKRRLAKRYAPDATMICGDWNLSIARLSVRAWFKLQLPRFRSTWDKSPVGKGTLGKRFIDITFVRRLIVVTAPKAHHTAASDHRYVVETLSFEAP